MAGFFLHYTLYEGAPARRVHRIASVALPPPKQKQKMIIIVTIRAAMQKVAHTSHQLQYLLGFHMHARSTLPLPGAAKFATSRMPSSCNNRRPNLHSCNSREAQHNWSIAILECSPGSCKRVFAT